MLVHITELPQRRAHSFRAVAEVLEVVDSGGNAYSCTGKMLLYFVDGDTTQGSAECGITYGDRLLVVAKPVVPWAGDTTDGGFNYRQYLKRQGILHTSFIRDGEYRITSHDTNTLLSRVNALRQSLIEIIHHSRLTSSQQGIAEALFLGWNDDLDTPTKERFKQAGIAHLLCVSGLHVGIVAIMIGWMLLPLGNRPAMRIVRGAIQIIFIWLFVLLTGMHTSTMRAGLMFTLVVVGQMLYSRPPTLNAIAASAIILLVCKPLSLFEVGFQLSYCSTIGIVLFTRRLERLIPLPEMGGRIGGVAGWLLEKVRSIFCVSVVAQISVAPLILYYFHSFPVYFLVANVVVVPFAGVLLGSVLLTVSLSWWPMAFELTGRVSGLLLGATEWVTRIVASWPLASLEVAHFDGWMLFAGFALLVLLGWWLLKIKID